MTTVPPVGTAGAGAGAVAGPVGGAVDVSISTVSRDTVLGPCSVRAPRSALLLGWTWRMEVSLDWVSVGCGVLFMMVALLFLCRHAEADSSILARGVLAGTGASSAPGTRSRISPSGVLMHSSDEEPLSAE